MKVLFLAVSLKIGGAERQFTELLKGIARHHQIEPHVYCLETSTNGYQKDLAEAGIKPLYLHRKNKFDASVIPRLCRIIRQEKIDVVHSFMTLAGLVASLAGRVSGVPVICSSIRNANRPDLKNRISLWVQALFSTTMVANSSAGLNNAFPFKSSKFKVVYNGIDVERFSVSPSQKSRVIEQYRLHRFDRVIIMIGALSPNKDWATYLEAASKLVAHRSKCGFLVVGDGPRMNRLKEMVGSLGIEDHVVFTGCTHQVPALLSATHVSVLMSDPRYHLEGLPNVLLESMAIGLPVIGSRGGGTAEVIRDGGNGFLVEPFDAEGLYLKIKALIDNPEQAIKMGNIGARIVRNTFDYSVFIDNYVDLYKEVGGG